MGETWSGVMGTSRQDVCMRVMFTADTVDDIP